jgi:hypothetical protein
LISTVPEVGVVDVDVVVVVVDDVDVAVGEGGCGVVEASCSRWLNQYALPVTQHGVYDAVRLLT